MSRQSLNYKRRSNTTSAIIVAAGCGTRMRTPPEVSVGAVNADPAGNLAFNLTNTPTLTPTKKQFLTLCGKPVLTWTIEAFDRCPEIGEIVVVVAAEDLEYCRSAVLDANRFSKVKCLIKGGVDRQASVFNGVMASDPKFGIIAVHDGVRPLIEAHIIAEAIAAAIRYGASCVAVPITDTIKSTTIGNAKKSMIHDETTRCATYSTINNDANNAIGSAINNATGNAIIAVTGDAINDATGDVINGATYRTSEGKETDVLGCSARFIKNTIDRSEAWAAQTPQCFDRNVLLNALKMSEESGIRCSDDASLVEMTGECELAVIMGSYENIKITTPIDLTIAECIIRMRKR